MIRRIVTDGYLLLNRMFFHHAGEFSVLIFFIYHPSCSFRFQPSFLSPFTTLDPLTTRRFSIVHVLSFIYVGTNLNRTSTFEKILSFLMKKTCNRVRNVRRENVMLCLCSVVHVEYSNSYMHMFPFLKTSF